MFLTQIYGTILGGFINYAVMISIVGDNRELLTSGNGNASWSGVQMQSYNTNATTWALAKYLYGKQGLYYMVPIALAIGAGAVLVHRVFTWVSLTMLVIMRSGVTCLPFITTPTPPPPQSSLVYIRLTRHAPRSSPRSGATRRRSSTCRSWSSTRA